MLDDFALHFFKWVVSEIKDQFKIEKYIFW